MLSKGRHRKPERITIPVILSVIALAALMSGDPTARSSGALAPVATGVRTSGISTSTVPFHSRVFVPTTAPKPKPKPKPKPEVPVKIMPKGVMWIKIPAIGVDAPVTSLGLNPDGSVQVPTNYDVAGWWNGSPVPGDVGPALILGHIDSTTGPAVFYRLRYLAGGENIIVVRPDGSTARFVVTRLAQYSKTSFPWARVYGTVPDPELRLITCGGAFNSGTGHYVDNVVVYARST